MKNRLEKKSCLNNPAKLSLDKKLQPLWLLAFVLFIVIFMCGAFKEHRLLAVVKNNCDINNDSLPKTIRSNPARCGAIRKVKSLMRMEEAFYIIMGFITGLVKSGVLQHQKG